MIYGVQEKNGLMGFIFCKFTFVASLLYLKMINGCLRKNLIDGFYFFQVHFCCKSTLLEHDKWMFKKKWIDVMRLPYLLFWALRKY